MRHRDIKIVIIKKGQIQYYIGDCLFFGRIKKEKALSGLESGKYSLWVTVDHRIENNNISSAIN